MVQSTSVSSSGGKGGTRGTGTPEDGGLFFTEATHERPKGVGTRPLTPGPNCGNSAPRRSSISMFAPVTAMSRRSSWRQVSERNGSSVITNNSAIDDALKKVSDIDKSVGQGQEDRPGANALNLSVHMLEHDERISRENFFKVS